MTESPADREPTAPPTTSPAPGVQPTGSTEDGSEKGFYVYCIIGCSEPRSFGEMGIGDQGEVSTIVHEDLAAVVSRAPLKVYDPTTKNVLCHERVNETVMEDFTVLPMSFGTLFRTRDDIVELLRSTRDALQDVLCKMEGKIEFGLKITWDEDRVLERITRENEEIRRLKDEIDTADGRSTYFGRVQLGRLVEEALSNQSERYVEEVYETLRPHAVASRSNKPIGERMIMNAAFLVERDRADELEDAIDELGRRHSDCLDLELTGPWPPYNFVNIRLKLERVEEE